MSREEIEAAVVALLGKYGVRKIGLFGSFARIKSEMKVIYQ
jgi:predicted nucleotidyltransferase